MEYLTLVDLKDHLRIDQGNDASDVALTRLAGGAESWAKTFLNRPLHTLDADSPPASPFTLPSDLYTALLLWVEAYYDRDPTQMQALVAAAETLAYPYRLAISP